MCLVWRPAASGSHGANECLPSWRMTFRLPTALQTPDDSRAVAYLRSYFAPGAFTGALFDTWDSTGTRVADADRFTADDLVSITMLSVEVPARAAVELLAADNAYNDLLTAIGEDRDLADQISTPAPNDPAWDLDQKLRGLPGVGRTIASKLMARKRPRLVPIYDTVIAGVMQLNPDHWIPLHAALRDAGCSLQRRLVDLGNAADLPSSVSPLRVLDVVAWMEGRGRA